MPKLTRILFLILLLSAIRYPLPAIYAAVPHLINYQGRLTDSSGAPLNGTYDLTFRIYDAEAAGNLLWQETHSAVLIQKGIFSIMLGSVTSMDLPFDKAYFLEIKVGDEVMSPRQRITSAGYAIRAEKAEDANTVANVSVSTTPTANKLLPLDSNAKLPTTALKVYDSGWFAVSTTSSYVKTHNLGTTKVLTKIWFSTSSDGSHPIEVGFLHEQNAAGAITNAGGQIVDMTPTTVTIKTGSTFVVEYFIDSGDISAPRSGYYRIIMLALE